MNCRHCGEAIDKIRDPWGYSSYRGREYPWYHVEASRNSDGKYVTECGEGFDTEAEPEISSREETDDARRETREFNSLS